MADCSPPVHVAALIEAAKSCRLTYDKLITDEYVYRTEGVVESTTLLDKPPSLL